MLLQYDFCKCNSAAFSLAVEIVNEVLPDAVIKLEVPIPTLLFVASTFRVFVSNTASPVNVGDASGAFVAILFVSVVDRFASLFKEVLISLIVSSVDVGVAVISPANWLLRLILFLRVFVFYFFNLFFPTRNTIIYR